MAKFSMTSHVQGFLQQNGVASTAERSNGGHVKVRFKVGDQQRTYVCSVSASDRRAVLNATADLRRMLRG